MNRDEVLARRTQPLLGPAYGDEPPTFRHREYLTVTYRTDPDVLRGIVPEPLVVTEPLVDFEVVAMPDARGAGSYLESGQLVHVEYEGQPGQFSLAMYLDNHPAIAIGREQTGFPKKLGRPRLWVDSDTLIGTLDYGSLRVATATMGYKRHALDPAAAAAALCGPTFLLKKIPDIDGTPRICELIRITATAEIEGAWSGPGALELHPHALAPLAQLPVREIVSTTHIVASSFAYQPAHRVHDYLVRRRTDMDRTEFDIYIDLYNSRKYAEVAERYYAPDLKMIHGGRLIASNRDEVLQWLLDVHRGATETFEVQRFESTDAGLDVDIREVLEATSADVTNVSSGPLARGHGRITYLNARYLVEDERFTEIRLTVDATRTEDYVL
ncbi:acetoacetate decarboxylase [Nocardia sp. CDC159]|uniref:Acetoacetate decarboxylase n=1 Tax=Nocardia pulmonis TaxID=2951408 RepID=A0A9X2EDP6_9NOCA|nr:MULTISPECIES: acetoacetate decarboxylase [Nocardia]MCM6778922.1 acetoacetate decarboxylase [Nocardia pulmonis]MCM6791825.1 acetoacetate decarboxylase [Nocardia sp. CDC159]